MQLESLVLVGAVALAGVAGFDRLGSSQSMSIADVAHGEARESVRIGGLRQAGLIAVFDDVADLGRAAAKVEEARVALKAVPDLYDNIPRQLPRVTVGEWFEDRGTWTANVQNGTYDRADLAQRLVDLRPGSEEQAKLFSSAIFDIRKTLGDEQFGEAATAYRGGVNQTNVNEGGALLLALEYATRIGDLRPTITRVLARATEAPDLVERIRAVTEVFFDGIGESRLRLFKAPAANDGFQNTMLNALGRFEENVSALELRHLKGDNLQELFASLRDTSLSDEANRFLTERLLERFAKADADAVRVGAGQRLVREVLPAVIAGDPDRAAALIRLIDDEVVFANGLTNRLQLLEELTDAVRVSAARFRRNDGALPVVDEAAVGGDLLVRAANGTLKGVAEAYASFLSSVVQAYPAPAVAYEAVDVEKLIQLAAQRAALGRVDETRGFGQLIAEASQSADEARYLTDEFNAFAARFKRGRVDSKARAAWRQRVAQQQLNRLSSPFLGY